MTDSTNDWLNRYYKVDEVERQGLELYAKLSHESKQAIKTVIEQKHQQELIEARIDELGLALEAGHGKDWSAQMAGTCGHVGKRYMELQAQAHKEAKDKP